MARFWTAVPGAALAFLIVVLPTIPAVANDAAVSPVNFSESRGCEPHDAGFTRPYVSRTGPMTVNEQIRGPWGDMFGRTYYQVSQSLVTWKLPGTAKTMRVHARILPALEAAGNALTAHVNAGKYYGVYSAFAWIWRTVGGSLQPSEHAMGTAFDINPSDNPHSSANKLYTNLPSWFVTSFTNAGFCWGGSWVDIKDPMHFSWSGPVATDGYSTKPPPYPPVTSSADYKGTTVGFAAKVATDGSSVVTVADMTGEGAPDLVRVSSSGRLEAAGALGDYAHVAVRASMPFGSDDALVGDRDLDGVPDIWIPDRSGGTVTFRVVTGASDYTDAISVPTAIPSSTPIMLLGFHDSDFVPDVYAFEGSTFGVYRSTTSYLSRSAQLPTPSGANASWHFATGDHDLDGASDLFAVSSGVTPTLSISLAKGGAYSTTLSSSIGADASVEFGDYDGDGREDLFILSGSNLTVTLGGNSYGAPDAWFQRPTSVIPDAGPECVSAPCDTIGHVDGQGVWTLATHPRTDPDVIDFYYGNPHDVPFMGDWDCDGTDTPGLYRRADGFVYLRSTNTQGVADREFYFGNPADVPLVGDFNGDGCDTVSIFRPSEQRVYIIDTLGNGLEGLGEADYSFDFGDFGDQPFVGDFDGDGIDEIGLHRATTAQILLKYDLGAGGADVIFPFGEGSDTAIAGDWNGDGVDTVAVFRESTGNWYFRLTNAAGPADNTVHFHVHDDTTLPIAGRIGS